MVAGVRRLHGALRRVFFSCDSPGIYNASFSCHRPAEREVLIRLSEILTLALPACLREPLSVKGLM
jgi:hypothetical protein